MRSEKEILEQSQIIAVVGATSKEKRPGNIAPNFLINCGYTIIPVNPMEESVHGIPCVPDLDSITQEIDIVSVFRRSDAVPEITEAAIRKNASAVWMQEGVEHEESASKLLNNNIDVISNRCIHCAINDHFPDGLKKEK
ncbi:MAG: CoA-binding protein [SAR202 cluster bacterium]|nr:CoA-binding protein [SAR202 cluster bacterium]|tara:strand:+ start:617 stop:1033 length:417 start_codon:yes stop_codon:yes gene_type:complete